MRIVGVALVAGLVAAGSWAWQWHQDRQAWQQVHAALDRHDLKSASAHLDHYLQRQPDDVQGWFLAGRTARRLGRVADAEGFLERCQQLGGVTVATELEWDLLRVQQGRFDGIDARLRMTVGPDHPDASFVLEALARGYLKREYLKDAFQACELWLQREPGQPWPLLWRGWIWERLENLDRAHRDFQRAVEHAPDLLETRLALGNVLVRMRKPADAAEHFHHILTRSSGDHEALMGLAACRIDQDRPAEAIPLLDRVLGEKPETYVALLLRGRAAMQQSEFASAEQWLRRAVAVDPSSVEALHALVHCLRAQDKKTAAAELAPRVENLIGDLKRLQELIRDIGHKPNEVRPRHEAGLIAMRIGRPQEGLVWLEGALRAQGDHRPTHAVLADYYQQKGEPMRAEFHRRLARSD